jgi:HAD superfamily hydrolase (TIGR01490 family)
MTSSPLAIFDLDYTLLEGDSEVLWSNFLYEKKVVDDEFNQSIGAFYHDYEAGRLDFPASEALLLRPLTEHPLEMLTDLRKEYLLRIQGLVRPKMIRQVEKFRTLGYTLLLVTATNNFLAEPIAEMLEFPNLICTQIKMCGEAFTTSLAGIPAFREGKVQCLNQWLAEKGMTLEGSWGFSDSHNDLAILSRVEHPVAVNPDIELKMHATSQGWDILMV